MHKQVISGFGAILIFVLFFSIFFFLNFKTVIVSGKSMEETFHDGDRLLSSRAYWLIGQIRVGDIVVVANEDGKGYIIKRVMYLEGQKANFLYTPETWKLSQGEYVVPNDCIFVVGDNIAISEDSRKFGALPKDRILGKIVRLPESWTARIGIVSFIVIALFGVGMLTSAITHRRRSVA